MEIKFSVMELSHIDNDSKYRVQNNDEKSLWQRYIQSFKAWNYAQIYLRHHDFSLLFRTLKYLKGMDFCYNWFLLYS